ncbi:MAG: transcription-repair coupling factor, partial [Firmicutes bacterium]|nr:transcription-repair coupling factor [Bacillota bacterium]
VTLSLDAVMEYAAPVSAFDDYGIKFSVGGVYDIDDVVKKLTVMGYAREDMVESVGTFSIRGEILDVFSPNYENPIRIDFFDNEVETIKFFDFVSQLSLEKTDSADVICASEVILTDEKRAEIIERLEAELKKTKNEERGAVLSADLENFREKNYFPSLDKYIPMICGALPTILDYIGDDGLIFVIDAKRVLERGKTFEREKGETLTDMLEKNIISKSAGGYYLEYADAVSRLQNSRLICLETLSHTKNDFKYKHLETFLTKTAVSFHGKLEYLYDDLKRYAEKKTTVVILASTRGRAENIEGVLKEKGFDAAYVKNGEFRIGKISIVHGAQSRGFEYPDINFVLISDGEIFSSNRKKRSNRLKSSDKLKSYNDISVGDYVVHALHGIGRYMGTEKITAAGATKDYLKIQYRGTDVLYVPTDQLSQLYKYSADTDKTVRLNKLGTQEWNKTKQKVKQSTDEMAKRLVKLYSARESSAGYAYSADTPWQRDFEDEFEYTETDDQLRSIEEVKADMESAKPMDRLLCGDVGFGKTEVALRAAFKAVTDSKQVAYFCPTTVLAMQQYETFVKRMENFPIRVEMLSRFKTPAETKRILKTLKTGETDIVIGTHKLLSKNVEFKDLGLLIVDEEQRFGVAHKEKLKELKSSVDVLTMTATPIPRTLHMAMTSVRDMSVLTEPPENRYPVQTYVLENNETVISDAVRNELSRGGQVFYLYNRVSSIYKKAESIRNCFPNANISVAHGQMNERELEDIMCAMADGDIDILVCTTIIETGLDIPNANTIIIEDADRMGLAQLYQLRGRVGRSNRAAYAYLTYRRDKVLSETAAKRLGAIKEFTEFGSGFKLAMRDLEIRGAGNLLGAEQHGHMDTVGYDMYCKLLKESINEARDIKSDDDINVTIDVEVDAFLPDTYIANHNQRIDMYKRISAIASEDDKFEIEDELADRYGAPPKQARNIVDIAMLKVYAGEAGIFEINQHGLLMQLKFREDELNPTLIWDIDGKYPKRIKVASAKNPILNFRLEENERRRIIEFLNNLLNVIIELKNPRR